ncbi:DUF72 domain-containing protein [Zobellella maritima]|uniref:DUF72 domain-containing protein n=1 Tax=Zobellella maritima TaxID=2059725 RepID=UPI000E30B3CA|nr:DUF72 domain-containing protein [Zobellella maritima]
MPLYLGLSQWSHPAWPGQLLSKGLKTGEHLADYSGVFNTVEGNTSFYGVPDTASLRRWDNQTPDAFRFTFKFPSSISHRGQLAENTAAALDFINQLAPLHHKLGLLMLQLPGTTGPEQLDGLDRLLATLPPSFNYGVEVRHPAFFAKGEAERRLNRLLIRHGANRIIMDSRPVFSCPPDTPALLEAQSKKPRVPVHIIGTGASPVVRFIGHPDPARNSSFWKPWLPHINHWLKQDKAVYLFVHTADNRQAPDLAARLAQTLGHPLAEFPGRHQAGQGQLF